MRNGMAMAAALAAVGVLVCAAPASADEKGDEVIAKMDESMTRADDQYFEFQVINTKPGAEKTEMAFWARIKGNKRMTEFMRPADLKGTKALVMSSTKMYVYLPSYKKVRRVASHATSGSFMGTALSNEDISTVTYGPTWAGKLDKEDAKSWTVTMTPKGDYEGGYSKLVMTIDKTFIQPLTIDYYDKSGQKARTETREKYSCQGKVCNAEIMTVTDLASGVSTQMIRRKWKVNTGLEEKYFSVRNLQK